MASYHLTVKAGQRGKAKAHADYIAREGKYSERERYEDLEAKGYGNMPAWAEHNTAEFWQAADDNERANGSAYREIEVAIPRELTPPQRLELVRDFVAQELGEKHAYQFAIHTPKAALEKGEQPHAHIMYSERMRDGIERDPEQYFKRHNAKNPEKGGNKKSSGGKLENERREELKQLRERWADIQNKHLEKNGHNERVTHLSLNDQGITERTPEKHLGGSGVRDNTKKRALVELRAANVEAIQAQAEAAPFVEQHKKQELVNDFAKSAADKFKQRLAEKEQAKKAEQKRIEQVQTRREIDEIHAKAQAERQEQQRQREREQIERKAREDAAQKAQQTELDRVAAANALKAEQQQERQRQEEQRRADKAKTRDNDLEM